MNSMPTIFDSKNIRRWLPSVICGIIVLAFMVFLILLSPVLFKKMITFYMCGGDYGLIRNKEEILKQRILRHWQSMQPIQVQMTFGAGGADEAQ